MNRYSKVYRARKGGTPISSSSSSADLQHESSRTRKKQTLAFGDCTTANQLIFVTNRVTNCSEALYTQLIISLTNPRYIAFNWSKCLYDSFNEYRGSYPVSEPYGTLRFLVFSHKKYFAFFSILERKLVCVFF